MHRFIICVIVLTAIILRFYKLDSIPNGFFFDEATISYQAYSVLQTGHDTWNNFFPVFSFKDYGEYILPVGVYLQTISIFFGGLTVFAARFPHALVGILTVIAVYFVGRRYFDDKTGLIAAALLTVSPLALGWNRFVFEGNFGTLFFLLGILFFDKRFVLSAVFFGLSMLSYHIFLIITPIFILLNKKFNKKFLLVFFIFGMWAAGSVITGSGRARFTQAANLVTEEKIAVLNREIGACQNYLPGCRLFLNKPVLYSKIYLDNYFSHFSPQFLGFDGSFLRRNILPKTGIILSLEIIAFYLGILFLIAKKQKDKTIFIIWLLLYPVANSFTGLGEISRIAFAAPLLSLVSAAGLKNLFDKSQFLCVGLSFGIIFSALYFLISYFGIFPAYGAYYTNYGYDRIFKYISQYQNQYKNIYITKKYYGSVPYISALFFLPVDPKEFNVVRHQDKNGYYLIDQINNLIFYDQIPVVGDNDLIVATPEEINPKKVEFKITDPTGRDLLLVVKGENL